ncbi:MAG: hypothetical protein WC527_05420 [Candidatus Margulisiibacteriota bacterium]
MTTNTVVFKVGGIERSARMYRVDLSVLRLGKMVPLRPLIDESVIDRILFPSAAKMFFDKGILIRAQDNAQKLVLNTKNLRDFITQQNGIKEMRDKGFRSRSSAHALSAVTGRLTNNLSSIYGELHKEAAEALWYLSKNDLKKWNEIKRTMMDPFFTRMNLSGLLISPPILTPPPSALWLAGGFVAAELLPHLLGFKHDAVISGILMLLVAGAYFYAPLHQNRSIRRMWSSQLVPINFKNVIVSKDTFLVIRGSSAHHLCEGTDASKIDAAIERGRRLMYYSAFYPDLEEAEMFEPFFFK